MLSVLKRLKAIGIVSKILKMD